MLRRAGVALVRALDVQPRRPRGRYPMGSKRAVKWRSDLGS